MRGIFGQQDSQHSVKTKISQFIPICSMSARNPGKLQPILRMFWVKIERQSVGGGMRFLQSCALQENDEDTDISSNLFVITLMLSNFNRKVGGCIKVRCIRNITD
ncbi:hypothetical protein JYU34_005504 [Plutella xylostella]|uniref:Uncharacterized protein n=1 Tax=Plutella xylostella TaxID=51655 RepID=A0ABQ7QTB9_PLUXY|nr:hypothetical protein JYU34_005504 [Plutella xylostella]